MSSSTQIPGFTPEQSWVIRTVAREAAREVIAELSNGKSCPFDCKDVAGLKAAVHGGGNNPGLGSEVTTLKEQVDNLVWWNRAAVAAAFVAIGSLVVSLICL